MPSVSRNILAVVAGIAIGGGVNMALILAGGVAAGFMIPAPAWFIALDWLAAYLPMAWLATRIGARIARCAVPAARCGIEIAS